MAYNRQLAAISQKPLALSCTIADNIALSEEVDYERVDSAIRLAGLAAVFAGILIVCRKVSEYLGGLYLKVQEKNYRINAQGAYWSSVMTLEDNAQYYTET